MAEFTNGAVQTVAAGQNVVFAETPVAPSSCVVHRQGSGVVTLRGMTNQCNARYKVTFGGNLAVPTGGTVGAVSVAIAVSGEPLASARMIVTPAAAEEFFNVFAAVYISVPRGCCVTIGVENDGTQAVNVSNANLIVERVA